MIKDNINKNKIMKTNVILTTLIFTILLSISYISADFDNIVFNDEFVGANGTAPNTTLWDKYGTPTIQGNKMRFTDNYIVTQNSFDTENDLIFETYADWVSAEKRTRIIIGDVKDTSIDFPQQGGTFDGYDIGRYDNNLDVNRYVNGVSTLLFQNTSFFAGETETDFRIKVESSNVSFWINRGSGFEFITSETWAHSNTNAYMYVGNDGTAVSPVWDYENATIFSSENISVSLDSPEDEALSSNDSIIFNASISPSLTINLTNATLFVWHDNGTIFNQTTNTVTGNTTNTTEFNISNFVLDDYFWNVESCGVNDTGFVFCSFADDNRTLFWRPFDITSEIFSTEVLETSSQDFEINISTLPTILSVSANLIYNGTSYVAITQCEDSICQIQRNIDIPLVNGAGENENKTFFWQIVIFDGEASFTTNTTSNQQNVTRIHLEICDATYTVQALNFSAYDEQNLTRLDNFNFQATFNSWVGGGTIARNSSFDQDNVSEVNLCLLPANETLQIDSIIDYDYSDDNITYVKRNYFFNNDSITNSSQDIFLYLLDATKSTTFILQVQDGTVQAVPGSLIFTERYYPDDNMYRVVQIAQTDDNGKSVGFYETETVNYRHRIELNGTVLLNTERQKVVGETTPFTLLFTVGAELGLPWQTLISNGTIVSNITYNETTNIVTFTYIDTSSTIDFARLLVFQEALGNSTTTIICDVNSTQSSATLTCNVTGFEGQVIAKGFVGSSEDSAIQQILRFFITTARTIMGKTGAVLGWFIILTFGMAFIWNPTAGIIGIDVAIIFVNIIGLLTFSPIVIFSIIAVSIVLIILFDT